MKQAVKKKFLLKNVPLSQFFPEIDINPAPFANSVNSQRTSEYKNSQ